MMTFHLLTDDGTEMADTFGTGPPDFEFDAQGVSCMVWRGISFTVTTAGIPAWILIKVDGRPWNIGEVSMDDPGQYLAKRTHVEVDQWTLSLSIPEEVLRRLRVKGLLPEPMRQLEAS